MRIRVTIEGSTPLLMNRFIEAVGPAGEGTSPTHLGDRGTPREQAEPKAYRDEQGRLYLPGANIFSAIVEAGRFHKSGKSKLTTLKSSLIPAGFTVEDLCCPLGTKDFEVDSRSIVNPATGGRRMCHRPRLDKWRLSFEAVIDTAMFSPKLIRQVIDDAGQKVGLGDFRPQRKGPFGRFKVCKWEEVKEARAA